MRQHRIPVNTRQEIDVQTDVKLLDKYLQEVEREQFQRDRHNYSTRFIDPITEFHISPLGSFQFGNDLKSLINDFKEKGTGSADLIKRLEILESTLQGLLKREMLVSHLSGQKEEWSSYYETLSQKEKELLRYQNEQILHKRHQAHYENRIKQLEGEISLLTLSLSKSQEAIRENKIYRETFGQINSIFKANKNRTKQLERAVEDKIGPLLAQTEVNLQSLASNLKRDVSSDIKGVVNLFARELDRITKDPNITVESIGGLISGLYENFKLIKGADYFRSQFQKASMCTELTQRYSSTLSLLNNQFQLLLKQDPFLTKLDNINQILKNISMTGVEIYNVNGWTKIVKHEAVHSQRVGGQNQQLLKLLGFFGVHFRQLLATFPEYRKNLPLQLVEFLSQGIIEQLIEGDALSILKQLIVYQVREVKVDNFYSVESQQDKKLILHLKYLIKQLLAEFARTNTSGLLNPTIVDQLNKLNLEILDVNAIIQLLRPLPRVEVTPIILDNPVFYKYTLQNSVPVNTQSAKVVHETSVQVVEVSKPVPVKFEVPLESQVITEKVFNTVMEKAVAVPTRFQTPVDRIVQNQVFHDINQQKIVYIDSKQEIEKQTIVEKIVEKPTVEYEQRIVQKTIEVIRAVPVKEEILVQVHKYQEIIKEVEVKVEILKIAHQYKEIEKIVNVPIHSQEAVILKEEVPIHTTIESVKFQIVPEIRQKIVEVRDEKEIIKEVHLETQVELTKEVPKEIFIERTHFVEGPKVQVVKQVEIFSDRPVIHQILVEKEKFIQLPVPLHITEQVPVYQTIRDPYVTEIPKEVPYQVLKVVPAYQQKIVPVLVEKPVPILVEKQIVKVEKQYIEKIVERIVQVPRVVQIERIVQKIVVVPRVIERIVEVPVVIEKIVIQEVPILQIVEIPYEVIKIETKQIIKMIEVPSPPQIVYHKVVQIVEKDKIVELKTEIQVMKVVDVTRDVFHEVLREHPVQIFRDRIQYQTVEIHQVKVHPVDVPVPMRQQIGIPLNIQKPVVTEHIIKELQIEKEYHDRIVEAQKIITKEVAVQIIKQVPIIQKEIVQIQGPERIVYQDQFSTVEVVREKIVDRVVVNEVVKEVYLEREKLSPPTVIDRIVEIPVQRIVTTPEYYAVHDPVALYNYKEIPIQATVTREIPTTRIIQEVKNVDCEFEKIVEIQVTKEVPTQLNKESVVYLVQEVTKEIQRQLPPQIETKFNTVEVPGRTVVIKNTEIREVPTIVEKNVEKLYRTISMMPQVVEVVKNINHIAEIHPSKAVFDVDVEVHKNKFNLINTDLVRGLTDILRLLEPQKNKSDIASLIQLIRAKLAILNDWNECPKIVEVPREVEKIVQVEKIVVVPSHQHEGIFSQKYKQLENLIKYLFSIVIQNRLKIQIPKELADLKILQLDPQNPNLKIGDYQHESSLGISIIGYNAAGYDRLTSQAGHLIHRDQETSKLINAGGYQALSAGYQKQYLLSGRPFGVETVDKSGAGYNYLFGRNLSSFIARGEESEIQAANFLLTGENEPLQSTQGLKFLLGGANITDGTQGIKPLGGARTQISAGGILNILGGANITDGTQGIKPLGGANITDGTQGIKPLGGTNNAIGTQGFSPSGSLSFNLHGGSYDLFQESSALNFYVSSSPSQASSSPLHLVAPNALPYLIAPIDPNEPLHKQILRDSPFFASFAQAKSASKDKSSLYKLKGNFVPCLVAVLDQENPLHMDILGANSKQPTEVKSGFKPVLVGDLKPMVYLQSPKIYELRIPLHDVEKFERTETLVPVSKYLSEVVLSPSNPTETLQFLRKYQDENQRLSGDIDLYRAKMNSLKYFNRKIYEEYSQIIQILKTHHLDLSVIDLKQIVNRFSSLTSGLSEHEIISYLGESKRDPLPQLIENKDSESYQIQIRHFAEKTARAESRIQHLESILQMAQSDRVMMMGDITRLESQLKTTSDDYEKRIQQILSSGNTNANVNELLQENRNLKAKNRDLERNAENEIKNAEKLKKDLERLTEKSKKDLERELQRLAKEGEDKLNKVQKESDRIIQKLTNDKKKLESEKKIQTPRSGVSDELVKENTTLKRRIADLESDLAKKKAIEQQFIAFKASCERNHRKSDGKGGFLDIVGETSMTNENLKLKSQIRQLESQLKKGELESSELKNLKDKIKRLEVELETSRKEVEIYQKSSLSKVQSTGYQPRRTEESDIRSPGSNVRTSGVERAGYMSPQSSIQSEERSSSSRVSGEMSSEFKFKPQMTMKEFIELPQCQEKEQCVTKVMIKVIQKLQEEQQTGQFNCYSPSNIYLAGFNPKNLDKLVIKFGVAISNKKNKNDGLYLSPEFLRGEGLTKKSIVFSIGVILDELLHGQPFFTSMEEIENPHSEFKVRGEALNPILKNTLFEMMNKDPSKRLDLTQAKRRLSLQTYIASERVSVTQTMRLGRSQQE